MAGQNLLHIPLDMGRAALEHHVQVPGAGHAVLRGVGVHPRLVQQGVHPALRDEHVVGYDGLVVLPPAGEGEGLSGLMPVHIKGEGEPGPQLRLHAQQLQHVGVGGRLVGTLLGQAALRRVAVHPVGVVGVGVAHLHVGFVERVLSRHTHEPPQAGLPDQGVVLQRLILRFGQVFEAAVGVAAHLPEVVLLESVVDGQGDGEQGGKEHRGQRNSQHRDEVAGAAGPQAPPCQGAHTLAVGDVHTLAPLPRDDAPVLDADDAVGQLGDLPRCG